MITNIKIKATPVKEISQEELMKKLEAGKIITGVTTGKHHQLAITMEADIDTIKSVVGYIQELGKAGAAKG